MLAVSGTTHRVGDAVGTVSSIGDALGGTIRLANRMGHGLADVGGEIGCSIIGGKGCDKSKNAEEAPENQLGGFTPGDLLEITALINTLTELTLLPMDRNTDHQ